MSRKNQVAIIGAGPAGMMAAIEACRAGAQVTLLDGNPQAGRKLRITGGGRGNLTNRYVSPGKYYSHHPAQLEACLAGFGCDALTAYLEDLGLYTYQTEDGWVYPRSNSAANAADLLSARTAESGAVLQYENVVTHIETQPGGFRLHLEGRKPQVYSKVVVACGGKAYPQLGSDGSLMSTLHELGHTLLPVYPALAPVMLEMGTVHKLQGLRLDAGLTLWQQGECLAETFGNIIFTNWGINGPGAMDLSHWISLRAGAAMSIEINLVSGMEDQVSASLSANRNDAVPLSAILGAFLPPKAVQYILARVGIAAERQMKAISPEDAERAFQEARHLRIAIKGVKGFDQCQVSTGGVPLEEVTANNLESTLVPGLFFAGEVLDVIGPCGGYNLHWAFSSGIRAGRSAGRQD